MTHEDPLSRRSLKFEQLDEVARDVESLLAGGCQSVGRWDLAQVCQHLADWMSFSSRWMP
jgi:hypothetical protein